MHQGITNQRETTIAWSRATGKPLCRAIVWTDSRTRSIVQHFQSKLETEGIKDEEGTLRKGTEGIEALRKITGLPLSTYFSALKLRWMIDNNPEVRDAHDGDDLAFGTVESWLTYVSVSDVRYEVDADYFLEPCRWCRYQSPCF